MKIHAMVGKSERTFSTQSFPFEPLMMQAKALTSIGSEVGQFIGYKGTLCEIVEKRGDEVNLIAGGWVKLSECSTNIEP